MHSFFGGVLAGKTNPPRNAADRDKQDIGNVPRKREAIADADKFVESLKAIWQPHQ
jgi:hypothetical protein